MSQSEYLTAVFKVVTTPSPSPIPVPFPNLFPSIIFHYTLQLALLSVSCTGTWAPGRPGFLSVLFLAGYVVFPIVRHIVGVQQKFSLLGDVIITPIYQAPTAFIFSKYFKYVLTCYFPFTNDLSEVTWGEAGFKAVSQGLDGSRCIILLVILVLWFANTFINMVPEFSRLPWGRY